MNFDEMLKKLGLDSLDFEKSRDGAYIADIFGSDEFGRIFSKLERTDGVDELYDNSVLTANNTNVFYLYNDYQINLQADFEQDLYKVIITEYEYYEDDEDDEEDFEFGDEED